MNNQFNKKSLALVTPAKNESENIAKLVNSLARQSLVPKLWVFINDGSTDGTELIFENEVNKYLDSLKDCIIKIVHHQDIETGYALGEKYSRVIRYGLDIIDEFEKNNSIEFDFIGILDADVFPRLDYYERIIEQFNLDDNLGIASGGTQIEISDDGKKTLTFNNKSHAPGGFRVWRRQCLFQTGYTPTISQDAVSQARAIILNWKVRSFPAIQVEMRKRGSVYGYQYYGKSSYIRWVPQWYVLLGALRLIIRRKKNDAKDYLSGYYNARNAKLPRLKDPIAKKYYRYRIFYKLLGK